MIIAFDLDDVLADFTSSFIDICNVLHGKPGVGAEPIDWEWSNFDLTPEQLDESWKYVGQTWNFWSSLSVEHGVDPRLIRRVCEKHDVVFPTARALCRGESVAKQSARWLQRRFDIDFPAVFVSSQKGPLAAAMKYDYFIDDRPKNCVEVKQARPECKVFLKDSSHNRHFSHPDIPRINGANEFCKIILEEE